MISTPTAEPTTAPTSTTYGVFTVAGMHLALPVSHLREVIPRPGTFEPLPTTSAAVVGGVNLRHQVIPVLDLRRLLAVPADDDAQIIIIVVVDDHLLGLLACTVSGVVAVPAVDQQSIMAAGAGPALFTSAFEGPAGNIVTILDGPALAELPGVPLVRSIDVADPTGSTAEGDQGKTTIVLLRTGTYGMCIDVAQLHSVIPELVVQASPITAGAIRGVVRVGDAEIPVVDLLELLGIGDETGSATHRGIAVKFPQGLIVFAISEVVEIVAVSNDTLLPLPPGTALPSVVSGVLTRPAERPYLVIDTKALHADGSLYALAALNTAVDGTAERRGGPGDGVHGDRELLIYRAGVELATPLIQVDEILPFPTEMIPLPPSVAGSSGLIVHREVAIPLWSLAELVGHHAAPDPNAKILLVQADVGPVGFVVSHLYGIELPVWSDTAGMTLSLDRPLHTSPIVEVGRENGEGRMLTNLDLAALANLLTGQETEHPGRHAVAAR
ncbi:chemotaxis protein CheW [Actinoplanes sp. NPDC051859]|uniref:chemotaxis protein CheW n=1 Tax=Actinoplanes sp. NPDC051859 TaxID=3363909 RepID=UPI0037B3FE74